jgi:hypothetical protein
VSGFLHRVRQRAVGLVSNVLCRSVCCGEMSELSGQRGYASPLSCRPQSRAEARLSELIFAVEWTNSSALRSPTYPTCTDQVMYAFFLMLVACVM